MSIANGLRDLRREKGTQSTLAKQSSANMATVSAPRPISQILREEEIDAYVADFYDKKLGSVDFSPEFQTLSPKEFEDLLEWIEAYDPKSQTQYDLYARVIDAKLSFAEQLICFEAIWRLTKSGDDDDCEPTPFDDEYGDDDTCDY